MNYKCDRGEGTFLRMKRHVKTYCSLALKALKTYSDNFLNRFLESEENNSINLYILGLDRKYLGISEFLKSIYLVHSSIK